LSYVPGDPISLPAPLPWDASASGSGSSNRQPVERRWASWYTTRHACLVVYMQAWSRGHFDEAAVALVDGSVDDTVDNGPDLGVTRGDLWTPKPPEKNLEKGPIRPLRAV